MSNLVLNATRVARHSARYFLVLCGWCDAPLGPVGGPLRPCGCDRRRELFEAAALWFGVVRVGGDAEPAPRPRRRALRSQARLHSPAPGRR